MSSLAISSIRLDGGTQSRAQLSEETIAEYAEAMLAGAEFPAPVVFYDGETHWLADGFHRVRAHIQAEHQRIKFEVRQGSQRDAILFSVSANASHGLRRTNADKRRGVELLLRDLEWSKKSDRWIAETVGVSPQTVSTHRSQLSNLDSSLIRQGKDGKARELPKRVPAPPSRADIKAAANDFAASIGALDATPTKIAAGALTPVAPPPPAVTRPPPEPVETYVDQEPESVDDDPPDPEIESSNLYRLAVEMMEPFSGNDLRAFRAVLSQLLGRVEKEMRRVSNA